MNNLTLSFAGHSVEWDALPENSQRAIVTLGYSTKLKNSIAGLKAKILGTAKDVKTHWTLEDAQEAANDFGLGGLLTEKGIGEEFANAVVTATQAEMFEALLKGIEPSARRGGARLSDDEKLRLSIEIELLEKWAKANDKTLPKRSKADEKEAFNELLAKARTRPKFADGVEKEFAKRKNAKAIEIDLDF